METPKEISHRFSINDGLMTVMKALDRHDQKAYLYGKCLRNMFFSGVNNKTTWHLATSCEPQQIKKILEDYKDRRHNYGIHYYENENEPEAIVAAPWSKTDYNTRYTTKIKISTFSTVTKENKKRIVKFCKMGESLDKVDFTIDALHYDHNRAKIIDYIGGFEDIMNKNVRFTKDPEEVFNENPLKILTYLGNFCYINPNLKNITYKQYDKIIKKFDLDKFKEIHAENISREFLKWASDRKIASMFVSFLREYGILENVIFPGCNLKLSSSLSIDGKDPDLTLIVLLSNLKSDDAAKILKTMRYPLKRRLRVKFMLMFLEKFDTKSLKENKYIPYILKQYQLHKNIDISNLINHFVRKNGNINTTLAEIYNGWNYYDNPKDIWGNDFFEKKKLPGKEIGQMIKEHNVNNFWSTTRHYDIRIH